MERILKYAKLIRLMCFGVVGVGVAGLATMLTMASSIPQLPPRLEDIFGPATEIYAYDGEGRAVLVHTLGGHQRVTLDQMAMDFRHAVIATEDADFYGHHGLDKWGILYALFANLRSADLVGQGGSTITQQLARRLFFSLEKVWLRKLREAFAATQIETRYSKEEILAAYCNNMYYGASAFGVEEAAQRFFHKHAIDLTLGESAFLAGLLQAPSRYNPYYHMDRALKRRETVLDRMVENHFITEVQAREARAEPLDLRGTSIGAARGPFFLDHVEDLLVEKYGNDIVYSGGLKIYTTMDLELQRIAEEAVRVKLAELDSLQRDRFYRRSAQLQKDNRLEAALVSIDVHTGAVRALVGGRDYTTSEFNRAVQSNRQPGSGFKPFLYLAAVDQLGYGPGTPVVDEPVSFTTETGEVWEPKNFSRKYEGPMILKRALMRSINVVSARLITEVGPQTVVQYARRLGVTSPLDAVLSLALGTSGVSPLEMASAYSVFAAGGIYHRPYLIERVEDAQGQVLEEFKVEHRRAVSEQSAYLVLDMLRAVVQRGTAADITGKYAFTVPCGGKTGTSSESKDVWFNGFTADLSTTVWVGHDDSEPLKPILGRETTGGSGAIPIWVEYMKRASIQLTKEAQTKYRYLRRAILAYNDFPVPLGIEFATVDMRTGRAPSGSDSTLTVAVRGATPKERE
ncbi:MAG: PBP1A family penicillin-binding protein [candidate division Zixibacteria bacterium]|nr:PBP1A family penicillin-binding protein [candidate division Zixibacteria bacterium]